MLVNKLIMTLDIDTSKLRKAIRKTKWKTFWFRVKISLREILCIFNYHKWIDDGQNPIYPPHRGRKCIVCGKKQTTGDNGVKWYTT